MSTYLTPEDGPFVFGAYASLFRRTEQHDPTDAGVEVSTALPDDGEDEAVVQQIAS
jgi:hypothetical protein